MLASRNFGLDLLRAIAIVAVVVSHSGAFLWPFIPAGVNPNELGYFGVELFFVLSGFLIGRILLKAYLDSAKPWLSTFYARRWFRTLPNYYLFLVIAVVLSLVGVEEKVSSRQLLLYGFFSQNLFSPNPAFFPIAWSLAIEEVFYLLFPLMLVAFGVFFRRERAFLAALAVMIFVPLIARVWAVCINNPTWDGEVRKIVAYRLDSFAYGISLAYFMRRFTRIPEQKVCAALGFASLFLSVCLYSVLGPLDESWIARTMFFSITSFSFSFLTATAIQMEEWRGFAHRYVRLVSKYSYSLYLAHWVVLRVMVFGLDRVGIRVNAWTSSPLFLVYCVASFGLAAATYRYFERPILLYRDRNFSDS